MDLDKFWAPIGPTSTVNRNSHLKGKDPMYVKMCERLVRVRMALAPTNSEGKVNSDNYIL